MHSLRRSSKKDIAHTIWDCNVIHKGKTCQNLRELRSEDLPVHLRFGIPSMMSRFLHTAFCGSRQAELQTQHEGILKKMGIGEGAKSLRAEAKNCEAEELYRNKGIAKEELNSRQAFQAVKGGSTKEEAVLQLQ